MFAIQTTLQPKNEKRPERIRIECPRGSITVPIEELTTLAKKSGAKSIEAVDLHRVGVQKLVSSFVTQDEVLTGKGTSSWTKFQDAKLVSGSLENADSMVHIFA